MLTRRALSIISYMTKAALPAVSEVEPDKLDEFKKSDKVVLVAYLAADDKKNTEAYSEVANALRENYLFGSVKDADSAKAEGVKQPALVLYKTFDEGKNVYDGKFEKAAITDFAKKAATPLVGEVGPDTYQGYMDVSIHHSLMHGKSPADAFRLVFHWRTSSPTLPKDGRSLPTP